MGTNGFDDSDIDCYSPESALQGLRERLVRLERKPPRAPREAALARNVARLGDCLGLDEVEQDILHLTTLARTYGDVSTALDFVGPLNAASVCRLYGECLGHPLRVVRDALVDRAKLSRAALCRSIARTGSSSTRRSTCSPACPRT